MIRVGAVTNEAHAWCAKNSLIRDMITQRWVTIVSQASRIFPSERTAHARVKYAGEGKIRLVELARISCRGGMLFYAFITPLSHEHSLVSACARI